MNNMRKYLEYYENEWPENIAELRAVENGPFVGYLNGKEVLYTVIPKPVPYLTFTALEDNCAIGFYNNSDSSIAPTVEYSFDKKNWNTLTDNITIPQNTNMYCRGINPDGISSGYGEGGYNYFTGEGKFNVSGDIMSLIDYETMPETMVGTFYNLFGGDGTSPRDNFVDIVDAGGLILSAKTLTDDCYANMFDSCTSMVCGPKVEAEILAPYCCYKMFYNCTSLTTAPELPATKLEKECYAYMFTECTSLTTTPVLPATILTEGCYAYMFKGCTSLTVALELPATELADNCYESMFQNCTSLTTAPELPAIELVHGCYYGMFSGCSSLTTTPELPATTLAESCYASMFNECKSLTVAPKLPATTLAPYCYRNMFSVCRSLTVVPKLPATVLASNCYSGMFNGCTSLTTAPELLATTLAEGCYKSMFLGCTNLNHITCLATDISETRYTTYWVEGVSRTGTFVKHPNTTWEKNYSGVPVGWTVEDAEI